MRTCEEVLTALVKDKCNYVIYLMDRWHDEWRYEPIEDYVAALKKSVPEVTELQTDGDKIIAIKAECSDGTATVRLEDKGDSVVFDGEIKTEEAKE